jgi:hypothetical protein
MTTQLTVSQAIKKANEQGIAVSEDTIRHWAASKGMGRKVFGRWLIDPDKYERVLNGVPAERVSAA